MSWQLCHFVTYPTLGIYPLAPSLGAKSYIGLYPLVEWLLRAFGGLSYWISRKLRHHPSGPVKMMGFWTLPHNMAHWHTEYFKLKEFWENGSRKVTLTFPLPFSPEISHKTLMWEVTSLYPEEDKDKEKSQRQGKEFYQISLAKFPPAYYTYCILLKLSFLHSCPFPIKPSIKYSGLTVSLGLHVLMKVPMSH